MGSEVFIPLFGIVGFFGSITTFIYMRYKSRHAERMALIESGQSADILAEETYTSKDTSLKNGLFLIGAGLGFVSGNILEEVFNLGDGTGIFPMAAIGAGMGLVIFYIVKAKKDD